MNFYITGAGRGLGEYLANHFKCFAVGKPVDLIADIDSIIEAGFEEGSVVILNAHADQLEYVKRLKDQCRLVIMGSVASINPDPNMPEYSKTKSELETYMQSVSLHNPYPMLYLRLTSSSYKNYKLIADSIQFWLDNPAVNFIGYNIND
jgi:NAD(P)-dependent dehydrogenase (short-subunit alcohol dehydrogenase family)